VAGGDRRLQLVRTGRATPEGRLDEFAAFDDLVGVPAGAVLVIEQDDDAVLVQSRLESWSSISASRPSTSGSSGISEPSVRPRRIASPLSPPRTSE
jgi:hypothetical protein